MKVLELLLKYDDLKLEGEPINGVLPKKFCQEALGEIVGSSGYWVNEGVTLSGHVYRTPSGEVIVDGHLKGQADYECVSCGQRRVLSIQVREDVVIIPKNHTAAQESDIEGEGELSLSPDLYLFEGQDIDLAEIFREVLILNVPTHPRCVLSDAKCGPSLAENSSDELPEVSDIDPRWAPLLAMHDQLKSMNSSEEGEEQ
jgi:uncharacterized metal-binding protein YceD (DUF177 family)